MLTAVLVISLCISALCLATWATSQGQVENARAIHQHSASGVRERNLEALKRAERERRVIGWAGLAAGVVAVLCALLRD